MNQHKSLSEQKELIRAIIDRGEWKHSWHLPKDQQGYINWWCPETAERIIVLLEDARNEAIDMLTACRKVDLQIAHTIIKEAQEDAQR